MKRVKFALVTTVLFSLFCQESFARKSKIYIGLNGFNVSTSHLFKENSQLVNAPNTSAAIPFRRDTSSSNLGFGASTGYIAYYRKFFVAPELYFDYFNNSSKDFFAPEVTNRDDANDHSSPYKNDEIAVNYRFGARMNVGYNVIDRLGIYVNAGFGVVDYDFRWYSVQGVSVVGTNTYGGFEMSPVYGIGFTFDLNKNLILRAAHDYQQITARYVYQGFSDEIDIQTTRLGILFAF